MINCLYGQQKGGEKRMTKAWHFEGITLAIHKYSLTYVFQFPTDAFDTKESATVYEK